MRGVLVQAILIVAALYYAAGWPGVQLGTAAFAGFYLIMGPLIFWAASKDRHRPEALRLAISAPFLAMRWGQVPLALYVLAMLFGTTLPKMLALYVLAMLFGTTLPEMLALYVLAMLFGTTLPEMMRSVF